MNPKMKGRLQALTGILILLAIGAAVGAELAAVCIKHSCYENGQVVIDNQVYECKPTSKWGD